jgi:aquaporin Z
MAGVTLASCASEFIGTFLLILTVGCNVLSHNHVWAGVSIACVLMVSIYALAGASGANFNPAVSFALGLAGKMDEGWFQVGAYSGVQFFAAIVAAFCYKGLFGDVFLLGPSKGNSAGNMMSSEFFYTFLLVFAVLNTAASKKIGGKNQTYGLAIGFSIIAGAYGAGAISGGCFNPAVAVGIASSSLSLNWVLLYILAELAGAFIAVVAFKLVRPEEKDPDAKAPQQYEMQSKLIGEFLGTFILVLTVGLNVLCESKAAAFSIAASLMCMIYAIGDISGGHFNPAVTVAILFAGRGNIAPAEAGSYIVSQIVGGVVAAFTYAGMHGGSTFALGPGPGHSWATAGFAEVVFTFVLTFVVLCVATVKKQPAPELIGFAIGSCVTVGGFAIGKVSGGSLNPAVSVGIASADLMNGGQFWQALVYAVFECAGGALAAGVFGIVYPGEYSDAKEDNVA